MMRRVYLPSTLPEVRDAAELEAPCAFAVTSALRAAYGDEDDEALEYVAYRAAADASLVLLAGSPDAPRRRVVVAADVEQARDAEVAAGLTQEALADDARIVLAGPVAWEDAVSLHVDDEAAEPLVAAAIAGNESAIAALEEHELLWYDITERELLAFGR